MGWGGKERPLLRTEASGGSEVVRGEVNDRNDIGGSSFVFRVDGSISGIGIVEGLKFMQKFRGFGRG